MGMKSPDERVSLQAIEFWSTVCEEESELAVEAAEVSVIMIDCPLRCLT
jgi:importin subunit beta-1